MSMSGGDERACATEEEEEERRIHVFWDTGMLEHDTCKGVFDTRMYPGFLDILDKQPENADRVKNMLSILKKGPLSPFLSWHSGRPALLSQLYSFSYSRLTRVSSGQGVRLRFYRGPNATAPPPLVRYCADDSTLDIVFPDWSFWGWIGVENHNKVTSSQTWQASVFRGLIIGYLRRYIVMVKRLDCYIPPICGRENFDPIVDVLSGRDYIPSMVYGRNIRGQDLSGMYCAILTVNSTVVSAGLLRIFGRDLAELPLVATTKENQGKLEVFYNKINPLRSVKNLLSSYETRGYRSFTKKWEDAEEQGRSSNDILHAIVGTK
ncbi:hypothetical protein AgCh_012268 [Apium graveolens]